MCTTLLLKCENISIVKKLQPFTILIRVDKRNAYGLMATRCEIIQQFNLHINSLFFALKCQGK